MAPEIERITDTFLSNPERVEVARQATASETIEQGVVMFKGSRRESEAVEKRNVLRMMIDGEGEKCTNAIVFCNRKVDVDAVAKSLKKHGYDAAPIHGDLEQSQRTRTLDGFRAGDLRLLVASDVAARGLDVPAVSHVFNFDVPSHPEDYVHRIGRTGRAGRNGKAMMICAPKDEKNMAAIEALIQKEIPHLPNPLGDKQSDSAAPSEAREDNAPAKPRRSRSRKKPEEAPLVVDTPAVAVEVPKAAPQQEAQAQEQEQAKPAEFEPPQVQPKQPEPRQSEPRKPDEQTSETEAQQDNTKQSNSRGRGGRGRSGGGGGDHNKIVGMGDHMPSFIALSFEDRRTG
jgi:superfamily II DNA/RNA helicase